MKIKKTNKFQIFQYKFHIVMNNKVIKDLDLEEADGRHSPGVAAGTEHIFESLGKFMANGEKRQCKYGMWIEIKRELMKMEL
jgi:hypothetical protein